MLGDVEETIYLVEDEEDEEEEVKVCLLHLPVSLREGIMLICGGVGVDRRLRNSRRCCLLEVSCVIGVMRGGL